MNTRVAVATLLRKRMLRAISGRRRSRYLYCSRNSSFTFEATSGSSTGKGSTSAMFSTSRSAAATSTSPVTIFGLFVPAGRRRAVPVMATTHSLRNAAARSKISLGRSEGSKTVCVRPSRSRTSMKMSPPRSRREWTQPDKVTVCPMCAGRNSLQ